MLLNMPERQCTNETVFFALSRRKQEFDSPRERQFGHSAGFHRSHAPCRQHLNQVACNACGSHAPTVSCAPPSSLTLSLPPANNISSSASLMSPDSTDLPPSRRMLACATRRISSLMNAALTPLVRCAASLTTASPSGRPLP